MRADAAFSQLIGRIYDCALEPSMWGSVLGEITEVVQAYGAELATYDPTVGSIKFAASHGFPEDVLALAAANMHLNPLTPIGLIHPLLEPMCMSQEKYASVDALHASLYWRNCWARFDHGDHIHTPLTRNITEFGGWGVSRRRNSPNFDEQDVEFTRLISPHLRRSVLISGILGHQHVETGTLRSALNALSIAAFILAPSKRIVFRNARAQAELDQGSLLREHRGCLSGATIEATRLVAGLSAQDERRVGDARLEDGEGRVLYASSVALEKISEAVGEPVLLLLREPERELITPLSSAATIFRLTPGELQVLAQLLHGRSLGEAAEILGIARSTVKTHIDGMFRKTNTNRQAELLRVVLGLVSPLA